MTTRPLVSLTRHIDAATDVVYSYLVEPDRLSRWLGASCSLDPRPGGAFSMLSPNGMTARGVVVEAVQGRKLSFTWGFDGHDDLPPGSTLVEIELTPDGDGTRLTLTHDRLDESAIAMHRKGWQHYLARLALAADGVDPGPDPGAG